MIGGQVTARSGDRRCPCCGRCDRRTGYADETIRGSRYGIAVVLACSCRTAELRRSARDLLLSGQYRLHMAKEQAPRRRLILSMISRSSLQVLYAETQGKQHTARADCWSSLVPMMLQHGANRLVIERLDGAEIADQRNISDALAKADALGDIVYEHQSHRNEPLLWLADAVAWASGAGGIWVRTIRHLVSVP